VWQENTFKREVRRPPATLKHEVRASIALLRIDFGVTRRTIATLVGLVQPESRYLLLQVFRNQIAAVVGRLPRFPPFLFSLLKYADVGHDPVSPTVRRGREASECPAIQRCFLSFGDREIVDDEQDKEDDNRDHREGECRLQ